MTTSTTGINLIKQFEGCRLTAYKPVAAEQYYTIGYGHYGADVTAGMTITQAQADAYLKSDLAKYEKSVNALGLTLTQNQFDALVSFTYNCGAGNLKKLVNNRTLTEIADALLLYNKGSGQVLAGLTKRRKAERELFLKDYVSSTSATSTTVPSYAVGSNYTTTVSLRVRKGPGSNWAALKHSELTANAQKCDKDKNGCLDVGTTVTCKEIKTIGANIWIRIPSGWIAAYYNGRIYVK